jgi:hypothetical protein
VVEAWLGIQLGHGPTYDDLGYPCGAQPLNASGRAGLTVAGARDKGGIKGIPCYLAERKAEELGYTWCA